MVNVLERGGYKRPREAVRRLLEKPCVPPTTKARAVKAPRQGSARSRRPGGPACDIEHVGAAVDALERDHDAIPQPIAAAGCRPRACAADAPIWGAEYQEAVAEATERASIEAGDDEVTFKRAVRKHLREHPRYAEWADAEAACLRQFRTGHARRRKTETAARETKRRVHDVSRAAGEDIRGGAHHLDELHARRTGEALAQGGNIAEARRIEAEIRAKKRSRLR